MDRNRQIINWYRDISRISKDDKADFEVMLLDHADPADASAALLGLTLNLVQQGFREDVMLLLIDGTDQENAQVIQMQALTHVILLCELYDKDLRQSRTLQERLLDMLAVHGKEALKILSRSNAMNDVLGHGFSPNALRDTLIYKLVVVGEEANRMFDQSY